MRYLDANVILRYLTRDDEVKAAACFEFFQRLKRGDEEVSTCESIVAEVVYVLSSRALYHLGHEEVRARLAPILGLRGLKLRDKRVCLRALDLYATHQFLDFEDAVCLAHMVKSEVQQIVSYDRDFDRVPGTVRAEP